MDYTDLDFQFAWRWLVPARGAPQVTTRGLSADAAQLFMPEALGLESTAGEGEKIRMLIADLEHGAVPPGDATGFDLICAVGTGKAVRRLAANLPDGWPTRNLFALLPAAAPRLAVPLTSGRLIREGLRLHRPGRRLARLAVTLVRLLTFVGISAPIERKMLLIASRSVDARPLGLQSTEARNKTGTAGSAFAVYFGLNGPGRKTVALPVDQAMDRIFKTGWDGLACAALRAEHATLRAMAETPLAANLPAVRGFADADGRAALVQEYRPRRWVTPWRYRSAVVVFLRQLALIGSGTMALREWLGQYDGKEIATSQERLRARLDRMAGAEMLISVHREHGDFAPWNVSWDGRGLFVFDWENSATAAPALFDAFYFAAAPALHVTGGTGSAEVLRRMRELGRHVSGMGGDELEVYLGLWLFGRSMALCGDRAHALIDCYLAEPAA